MDCIATECSQYIDIFRQYLVAAQTPMKNQGKAQSARSFYHNLDESSQPQAASYQVAYHSRKQSQFYKNKYADSIMSESKETSCVPDAQTIEQQNFNPRGNLNHNLDQLKGQYEKLRNLEIDDFLMGGKNLEDDSENQFTHSPSLSSLSMASRNSVPSFHNFTNDNEKKKLEQLLLKSFTQIEQLLKVESEYKHKNESLALQLKKSQRIIKLWQKKEEKLIQSLNLAAERQKQQKLSHERALQKIAHLQCSLQAKESEAQKYSLLVKEQQNKLQSLAQKCSVSSFEVKRISFQKQRKQKQNSLEICRLKELVKAAEACACEHKLASSHKSSSQIPSCNTNTARIQELQEKVEQLQAIIDNENSQKLQFMIELESIADSYEQISNQNKYLKEQAMEKSGERKREKQIVKTIEELLSVENSGEEGIVREILKLLKLEDDNLMLKRDLLQLKQTAKKDKQKYEMELQKSAGRRNNPQQQHASKQKKEEKKGKEVEATFQKSMAEKLEIIEREMERKLRSMKKKHQDEQEKLMARLEALTKTNEQLAMQNCSYANRQREVQKSCSLANVESLWLKKDAQFSIINELMREMK